MSITVGLPRAMLYYRYHVLWEAFFQSLGVSVVVSGPTTRELLEKGSALAMDESCLSSKIWFGHVAELTGHCDYLFVPRIASFGKQRIMCTRFGALPDITRQALRPTGQKVIDCNVDGLLQEEPAYIGLGTSLGFSAVQSRRAYKIAVKEAKKDWNGKLRKVQAAYRQPGIRMLLAAHSYVYEDDYIGRPVLKFLEANQVTAIPADLCDRKAALKKSASLSPNLKWELNREILGSAALHQKDVSGIILMSAFPCGPDSMANDMLQRKITGVPMLNLTLDGQSGTAGLETRLESFLDIIRFKEGLL